MSNEHAQCCAMLTDTEPRQKETEPRIPCFNKQKRSRERERERERECVCVCVRERERRERERNKEREGKREGERERERQGEGVWRNDNVRQRRDLVVVHLVQPRRSEAVWLRQVRARDRVGCTRRIKPSKKFKVKSSLSQVKSSQVKSKAFGDKTAGIRTI